MLVLSHLKELILTYVNIITPEGVTPSRHNNVAYGTTRLPTGITKAAT
jgi:hypothetical protein